MLAVSQDRRKHPNLYSGCFENETNGQVSIRLTQTHTTNLCISQLASSQQKGHRNWLSVLALFEKYELAE